MGPKFEWDAHKREINLRKHGIDFGAVEQIFRGPLVTFEDERAEYGESRYVTFGIWQAFVVAVVHVERGDRIRIISIRKATKYETKSFFQEIGYRLGED